MAPNRKWTSIHDEYRTIEIIGQGTYGVVYKAEHRKTKQIVGLKRCRLDCFKEFGIPETSLREISLLKNLNHDNIMTLYKISCNPERLYLICEYIDLDLKRYIRAHPEGIPLDKVKNITFSIFEGLAFCHGHRILHRDLKPHNVLISYDASIVKLADFGLARGILVPGKTLTHEVITLWYRSPELLLGDCNYTTGVDIWSAGCIVLELLNSKPLYVGDSEIDTLCKIFRLLGKPRKDQWPKHSVVSWEDFPKLQGLENPFDSISKSLDHDGRDFISRIFQFEPNARISAWEALHHPWLRDVRLQRKHQVNGYIPEFLRWSSPYFQDDLLHQHRVPTLLPSYRLKLSIPHVNKICLDSDKDFDRKEWNHGDMKNAISHDHKRMSVESSNNYARNQSLLHDGLNNMDLNYENQQNLMYNNLSETLKKTKGICKPLRAKTHHIGINSHINVGKPQYITNGSSTHHRSTYPMKLPMRNVCHHNGTYANNLGGNKENDIVSSLYSNNLQYNDNVHNTLSSEYHKLPTNSEKKIHLNTSYLPHPSNQHIKEFCHNEKSYELYLFDRYHQNDLPYENKIQDQFQSTQYFKHLKKYPQKDIIKKEHNVTKHLCTNHSVDSETSFDSSSWFTSNYLSNNPYYLSEMNNAIPNEISLPNSRPRNKDDLKGYPQNYSDYSVKPSAFNNTLDSFLYKKKIYESNPTITSNYSSEFYPISIQHVPIINSSDHNIHCSTIDTHTINNDHAHHVNSTNLDYLRLHGRKSTKQDHLRTVNLPDFQKLKILSVSKQKKASTNVSFYDRKSFNPAISQYFSKTSS